MVPNFCVNLKPEKFHTVAHFKKKKKSSAPVWDVFCVSERRKKNSLVNWLPSMCSQLWDAESHFCDMSAPRYTVKPVGTFAPH